MSFDDGFVARIGLRVKDFGGRTQVNAESGTVQATPLRLPIDATTATRTENFLPDAGWLAKFVSGATIVDTYVVDDGVAGTATIDDDLGVIPVAAQPSGNPAGVRLDGDGFTRLEEYRGFVVRGEHRRTSPLHKDLFVATTVTRPQLSNIQALEFSRGSFLTHGMRLHHLYHEDEMPAVPEYFSPTNPTVNFAYLFNGFADPPISGYQRINQFALRIIPDSTLPINIFGSTSGCHADGGVTPNDNPSIKVDIPEHERRSNNSNTVNNEIRRTVGHELGHGIHVDHKGDTNPCTDNATTSGNSMMTSKWQNGADASKDVSKYNDSDTRQMRLRR